MNSISLTGRLTEAPELKQTTSGKSVVSNNLAVDRPFTKDVTDFIPVVIWNQQAEYLSKYAKKGTKVGVTGKLTTRKYEDKEGKKRIAFEVVADTVEICDYNKENTTEAKNEGYVPSAYSQNQDQFEEIPGDEKLPF
jgi:single-strand DNA-binding protein